MKTEGRPTAWKTLLAFAIIYFVWGSTYLAIRVGVREIPPFLMAAMRFFVAGFLLCAWLMARGERWPSKREWLNASLLSIVMFVLDYGVLFWAEKRIASGIAAVMVATIPVFMALSEIIFLRTQKLTLRLAIALLIGIGGVAVLMSRSFNFGGEPVDRMSAIGLLIASISWSAASVLGRKVALPDSKAMSAGAQMLAGGVFLTVTSAALGEFRGFDASSVSRTAWLALAYLIVAGSIVGFTAYVWLLHHESPTKVATYAYVNPVVAVLVGYFWGGEPLGVRTVVGTLLVLAGVVVITTTPARSTNAAVPEEVEATFAKTGTR